MFDLELITWMLLVVFILIVLLFQATKSSPALYSFLKFILFSSLMEPWRFSRKLYQ